MNVKFQIELYGFEACNKYYNNIINNKEIKEIYKKCKLKIYNLAISEHEIKLYHHKNTVGIQSMIQKMEYQINLN